MSPQRTLLQGTAYIPGFAQGCLLRSRTSPDTPTILLQYPEELDLKAKPPQGYVIIDGAPYSHSMIPLLATGIPTLIMDAQQRKHLPLGRQVSLDGRIGALYSGTHRATPAFQAHTQLHPCITQDGVRVNFYVSARDQQAIRKAVQLHADAIGLVRSEFLYPRSGKMPGMPFYVQCFRQLCEAAHPLPVTIRLLDLSEDKQPPWLTGRFRIQGSLGLHGSRLFFCEPFLSLLHAQLDAIDEVSHSHALRILIPNVDNETLLHHWLEQCRKRLSKPLPIGAMAETPAAALQLKSWLHWLDFAGVGCNDLMQCFFGADRERTETRHFLHAHSPSLYRFLQLIRHQMNDAELARVQLCGVLPQLPGILPLLIGLGYRTFSVEAASLPHLQQTVMTLDYRHCKALAEQACQLHSGVELMQLLQNPLPAQVTVSIGS